MLSFNKQKEKSKYEKLKEVKKLLESKNRKDFNKFKKKLRDIKKEVDEEIKSIEEENNLKELKQNKRKIKDVLNKKNEKEIKIILNQIKFNKKDSIELFEIEKLNIPNELKSEMIDDIKEIERCYKNKCYKASIIMCARVLETSLHRLYYEKTNNDLLEKAPGIGLGKLIAKLKKKQVNLDPSLTQQIHVINQARIYSVHKKKEKFNPTKNKTKGIILYTKEIVKSIFK